MDNGYHLEACEGEIHLPKIKVKTGISQGDNLSPLLDIAQEREGQGMKRFWIRKWKGQKTRGNRMQIEDEKFVEDLKNHTNYSHFGIEQNASLEYRKLKS